MISHPTHSIIHLPTGARHTVLTAEVPASLDPSTHDARWTDMETGAAMTLPAGTWWWDNATARMQLRYYSDPTPDQPR